MTILNRANDPIPEILVCICKALREWGPLERSRLDALLAPDFIVADREKFHTTLERWHAWGLIEEQGGKYRLGSWVQKQRAGDFLDNLRAAALDVLVAASNVPHVDTAEKGGAASNTSDFARVVSWCLLQDPMSFAGWNEDKFGKEAKDQCEKQALFVGSNILTGVKSWVSFTGLGAPTPQGLMLAPTQALRWRLAELLAEDEVPLESFLNRARLLLPVLPGGHYSQVVAGQLDRKVSRYESLQVAPSLSLALMQLHHEAEIRLSDKEGDAFPHFSLLRGDRQEWHRYSHVKRDVPRFRGPEVRHDA